MVEHTGEATESELLSLVGGGDYRSKSLKLYGGQAIFIHSFIRLFIYLFELPVCD